MTATLNGSEIAALASRKAARPEQRLSAMAHGLIGSEILRISGEIRALVAAGREVCDLTVGDFSPSQFPIPERLRTALLAAVARGETNYPPAPGLMELRRAIAAWYARELGLDYPAESVLVTSGSRPGIYGAFRTLVDPGERVVYSVPSWNNNHYTHMVGGIGVELPCNREENFLPSPEQVRAALPGARLLCLCSPLNPTGTVIEREVLLAICHDVLAENAARERRGERPLFLLYDQVYWTLTFGATRHFTPPALLPEITPFTVLVDGISKAFSGTGLRVGWVVGPVDVVARMSSLMGHVGAWAPRPEQCATIELLADGQAIRDFHEGFRHGMQSRLDALCAGFLGMKADGLAVDCLPPSGAIYLSARVAPFGRRTPEGAVLQTNDEVRRYLLNAAGIAVVPFQAFGSREEDGWFRLSAGAVSLSEIEAALPRLQAALRALA